MYATQRKRRQGQLGANELGEHLVQILEHILQKLPLRARLHQRHQHFMKAAAIAQKKNGQDRHQKQYPHFLCRFRRAHADALRQASQVIPATCQENLNTFLGLCAPAVFASDSCGELADLAGDLAGAGLVHKSGQRRSQAGALPGNPRAHKKAKQPETNQQQEVNDGDRPGAAA